MGMKFSFVASSRSLCLMPISAAAAAAAAAAAEAIYFLPSRHILYTFVICTFPPYTLCVSALYFLRSRHILSAIPAYTFCDPALYFPGSCPIPYTFCDAALYFLRPRLYFLRSRHDKLVPGGKGAAVTAAAAAAALVFSMLGSGLGIRIS